MKSRNLWKTGYDDILALALILWFVISVGALFIGYLSPEDSFAIFFQISGLILFWLTAILRLLNYIVEKKVNYRLDWLEYTTPFETKINLCGDEEDPIVSLRFDDKYVSRHNDEVYFADIVPLALGVYIYIFRNPKDIKKNFCIVYSRFDKLGYQFQAFKRAE